MLTVTDRLHTHIVLSLLTGARTEELRALEWQHVHLEWVGDVPPHVEVWRSVREGGDTKTERSRRTLALPERCIEALPKHRALQAAERLAAGEWWEMGLVFTTRSGRRWTRPMSGGTSEGRCAWSPGSTRKSGHPASCDNRSSQCCPMLVCR
jgi:integrase